MTRSAGRSTCTAHPVLWPARRAMWRRVYVIQGFSGQLDMWLGRSSFEPTAIERFDAMFAAPGGDCPDAVLVFVDAWTSLGGSQFINSPATGNYLDYICDEIVPFVDSRYPTAATVARRAITGKSSGGYGAMVLPMHRPDVFGALISHAGDALFEVCYQSDFGKAARALRDHYDGSIDNFLAEFRTQDTFDWGTPGGAHQLLCDGSRVLTGPRSPRPRTAAVRPGQRAARSGGLGALAGARSGEDGAALRVGVAWVAIHLPRRGALRRVSARSRGAGVSLPSSPSLASTTGSSCSTAAMVGSRTAIRWRFVTSCWRSERLTP